MVGRQESRRSARRYSRGKKGGIEMKQLIDNEKVRCTCPKQRANPQKDDPHGNERTQKPAVRFSWNQSAARQRKRWRPFKSQQPTRIETITKKHPNKLKTLSSRAGALAGVRKTAVRYCSRRGHTPDGILQGQKEKNIKPLPSNVARHSN